MEINSSNSRIKKGTLVLQLRGRDMTCTVVDDDNGIEVSGCHYQKFKPMEKQDPLYAEFYDPCCGGGCGCSSGCTCEDEEEPVVEG